MRKASALIVVLLLQLKAGGRVFPDLRSLLLFAEKHSPSVVAAEIDVEERGKELKLAERERLFVLSLRSLYQRNSTLMELDLPFLPEKIIFGTKNVYNFSLSLTQPLYTGGILKSKVELKRTERMEKIAEKQAALNNLFVRIAKLYYRGALLKLQLRIFEEEASFLRQLLKRTQDLYSQGQIEYSEVLSVKGRLATLKARMEELSSELERIRLELLTAAGCETLEGKVLFNIPSQPGHLPDHTGISRKELLSLKQKEKQLEWLLRIYRAERKPSFFLSASYSYGKPGVDLIRKEWMGYWSIVLTGQIKLWDWGRSKLKEEKLLLSLKKLRQKKRSLESQFRLQAERAKLDYLKNKRLLNIQ